jgi:hypothetical protein
VTGQSGYFPAHFSRCSNSQSNSSGVARAFSHDSCATPGYSVRRGDPPDARRAAIISRDEDGKTVVSSAPWNAQSGMWLILSANEITARETVDWRALGRFVHLTIGLRLKRLGAQASGEHHTNQCHRFCFSHVLSIFMFLKNVFSVNLKFFQKLEKFISYTIQLTGFAELLWNAELQFGSFVINR